MKKSLSPRKLKIFQLEVPANPPLSYKWHLLSIQSLPLELTGINEKSGKGPNIHELHALSLGKTNPSV